MTTNQTSTASTCDFCEFSVPTAVVCETCILRYCDKCFQDHHPLRGVLENHIIVRTLCDLTDMKCPLHNERFLHFCVTCSKRVCPHCLLLPGENKAHLKHPHLHHQVLTTEEFIESKKKHLLTEIERVSGVLQCAGYSEAEVEDRQLVLELSWLAYKDRVRQEFISMHDLLLQREQELLKNMQQSVNKSLETLTTLDELQKQFEAEETQLTEESIKLVQENSQGRFMKGYKNIIRKCEELCENIQLMPPLEETVPPFLNMPFTLIQEKLHLDSALQFQAYENISVAPISRAVYVPPSDLCKPIRCSDLWSPPDHIPASTACAYNVEISSNRNKIVKHENLPIDDFVFNSIGRLHMRPVQRYLLKVVPVYTVAGGNPKVVEGAPRSIMVVTGHQNFNMSLFGLKRFVDRNLRLGGNAQQNWIVDDVMSQTQEWPLHTLNNSFLSNLEVACPSEGNNALVERTTSPCQALSDSSETSRTETPSPTSYTAPISPTTSPKTYKTPTSPTPHTNPKRNFQMLSCHIDKQSFEESRLNDLPLWRRVDLTVAQLVSNGQGFVLDQFRYNMQEGFLLHHSFEESRLEYVTAKQENLSQMVQGSGRYISKGGDEFAKQDQLKKRAIRKYGRSKKTK